MDNCTMIFSQFLVANSPGWKKTELLGAGRCLAERSDLFSSGTSGSSVQPGSPFSAQFAREKPRVPKMCPSHGF